jgi:hypothetical protein
MSEGKESSKEFFDNLFMFLIKIFTVIILGPVALYTGWWLIVSIFGH